MSNEVMIAFRGGKRVGEKKRFVSGRRLPGDNQIVPLEIWRLWRGGPNRVGEAASGLSLEV
jgi:hypothetical protein